MKANKIEKIEIDSSPDWITVISIWWWVEWRSWLTVLLMFFIVALAFYLYSQFAGLDIVAYKKILKTFLKFFSVLANIVVHIYYIKKVFSAKFDEFTLSLLKREDEK